MLSIRSPLPTGRISQPACPAASLRRPERRLWATPRAGLETVDEREYMVGPKFARGAYGTLHRAIGIYTGDRRLVAKKMLVGTGAGHSADDTEAEATYQRRSAYKINAEIAAMRAVQSPLRPQSAHVGPREATLIMPYLDGDLQAMQDSDCGLALCTRRRMLRSALAQSAAELARMHEAQYLHLDIKPSNLFFERSGEVHLGDFGLAHPYVAGEPLTLRRGSPAMMAPEALLNKCLTPRAETWSLFVTWLDLAVGSRHNAFVTEPSDHLSLWRVLHGPRPFSEIVDAEDGPFRQFFSDLADWRAAHPGPLDARTPADAFDDPISQTFSRAYAFDPEMTNLGLQCALAENPEERADAAEFATRIRALQPVTGRDEAEAKRGFARLAAENKAGDKQFAALRREAAIALQQKQPPAIPLTPAALCTR